MPRISTKYTRKKYFSQRYPDILNFNPQTERGERIEWRLIKILIMESYRFPRRSYIYIYIFSGKLSPTPYIIHSYREDAAGVFRLGSARHARDNSSLLPSSSILSSFPIYEEFLRRRECSSSPRPSRRVISLDGIALPARMVSDTVAIIQRRGKR